MEYLPLIFIVISIAVQIVKKVNKKGDGMTEEERFEAMKRRIEEAQRRQREKGDQAPLKPMEESRSHSNSETSYQPTRESKHMPNLETSNHTSTETSYQPTSGTKYQPTARTDYQSDSSPSYKSDGQSDHSWPTYERDRQDNHGGQAMAINLGAEIGSKAQDKTANAQKDLIVARSTKPLYGKRRFSPLQQGILWATILDRPLSQQQHRSYRGVRSRV